MEDADDVVDRRVVGALLVVVVEAVELGDHDPDRQRGEEDERFEHGADPFTAPLPCPKMSSTVTIAAASPARSATTSALRTAAAAPWVPRSVAPAEYLQGPRVGGREDVERRPPSRCRNVGFNAKFSHMPQTLSP